ncbi:MAG: hydroxymethylbilane synthase [Syntrophorhabdus aromaticivorans]|uniref:Porphobilinogen deaminase n=1 Tax=Syntrophorhabdus aromaticivorans TaxID=328301 RepID=A0A971M2U6_9BACT|nr:hydroxymethylbilane synthase [Syntrophorhabdus aromaticivorans]
MKKTWTIGTRGSALALKQAETVVLLLQTFYPDHEFRTRTIKTTGDSVWDRPVHLIGGKGLFVREIEAELLAGTIDFAVHSMKDMPTEIDEGLVIGAILKREDPRDAFISSKYDRLADMSEGDMLGTNSLRRKSQVLNFNNRITVIPLRGNVDTRIRKMVSNNLSGIILAWAGVKRMGFEAHVKEILPLDLMVPPSGQGAIGIETRNESTLLEMLQAINHRQSFQEVEIERSLQARIGGGCNVPLGINASISNSSLTLRAVFGREDGEILVRHTQVGTLDAAEEMIMDAFRQIRPYTGAEN